MSSVLSTALRLGWVDKLQVEIARKDFVVHWPAYIRLPVSTAVLERAALLSWGHGLRAYGSVHLSSALARKEITGNEVVFACYDKNLMKAAKQERLQVWPDDGEG